MIDRTATMSAAGEKGKKRKWLPLESDPAVFNKFASSLGCTSANFCDVFGLEPDLLAFVPRPVVAVILLFPIEGERKRKGSGDAADAAGTDESSDVFYVKQKIGNACGTIALIHAIANNQESLSLEEGSFFADFVDRCRSLSPDERADYLDEKAEAGLEVAHNSAAGELREERAEQDMNTNLHFVCYVERSGHLWELDGRNPSGPAKIADGCTKDNLLEKSAEAIQKRMRESSSIQFNIMACALN